MKRYDEEIIELGNVSIETCGNSQLGVDDVQTGFKYLPNGILTED